LSFLYVPVFHCLISFAVKGDFPIGIPFISRLILLQPRSGVKKDNCKVFSSTGAFGYGNNRFDGQGSKV
jgi:hypothetical protein